MILISKGTLLSVFAPRYYWRKIITLSYCIFTFLALYGCSLTFRTDTNEQQPPPIEKAQVVFGAVTRINLKDGEKIRLVILDEVTGLPFNQQQFEMELYPGTQSQYVAVYTAPIGTVITFRFEKVNQDRRG